MIRKLTEQDRAVVMAFISDEPAFNLFLIGDIEAFGFDEDFQELWGQFDDHHTLQGVLLRYRTSFIPYFKDGAIDLSEFKRIIEAYPDPKWLSGAEKLAAPFVESLPLNMVKSTYFCELSDLKNLNISEVNQANIQCATSEDAVRIEALIKLIEEFRGSSSNAEEIAYKIKTKTGRVYYLENEAKEMVAIAQTSAENSKSAMIVGVATHPDYRRRGLVSACMTKLCEDVLKEGKALCLFYDNPDAGKIYHRLGFETIGMWTMIKPKA